MLAPLKGRFVWAAGRPAFAGRAPDMVLNKCEDIPVENDLLFNSKTQLFGYRVWGINYSQAPTDIGFKTNIIIIPSGMELVPFFSK